MSLISVASTVLTDDFWGRCLWITLWSILGEGG